jgi:regulator of replication initiation timing
MENKRGRQLPRTDFILQNENSALRNKVKILEESLVAAYKIISKTDKVLPNIISLAEENEKLKNENNQLRIAKEKAKLDHMLYC